MASPVSLPSVSTDAVPARLPWRAAAWPHTVLVASLSVALFLVYERAYFDGIRSSDGANYATVARNVASGRGLVSSVIQPGLIDVVPTDRSGQVFVIQAPAWPLLLAAAFRLRGANESTLLIVSGTLFVLVMVAAWWLAVLWTGSLYWAYAAWAFLITNPYAIGTALAGANVLLQSFLLVAIFLACAAAPRLWNVLLVGLLLGIACVTRENSAFVFPAIALMWHQQLSTPLTAGRRQASFLFLRSAADRNRLLLALAVAGLLAVIPIRMEAARKSAAIGHADAPVLRMTFLYHTSIADQGWYFIYRHPMLAVNPKSFFREHPEELFQKIAFQIRVLFLRETVPSMLSFLPFFVPVLIPRFAPMRRGRVGIWATLAFVAIQVVVGAVTILNFIYFFAFLPVIVTGITATAAGLLPIAAGAGRSMRNWGYRGLFAYALAPLFVNVALLASGERPGTGDYHLSPAAERALSDFIGRHTEATSVIACSHSALMAWDTGRTILMYSGHPRYTIGDTPMWRAVDSRVRIDYILLNSFAYETPERTLLPGFRLVASAPLAGEGEAWLFGRRP
jgi:hypothetical protein